MKNIKAISINKNLVVLIGGSRAIALNPCYNSSEGHFWTIVCNCGCSDYPLEKAAEVARESSCELVTFGEGAEDFLAEYGFINPCHCTKKEIEDLLLSSNN